MTVSSRFATPVSDNEILRRRDSAIPQKTAQDTRFCTNVWQEWSDYHQKCHSSNIPQLNCISASDLQYWLTRFVLEIRKRDGSEYPPQTLHHICSGLQRYLRLNGHPTLDIYTDSKFAEFRSTLDAEMKRLQQKGIGSVKRQAEPITEVEEDILCSKGLLGDHTPQALLNTIIFMNWVYFALRSGKEHRELRHESSQIQRDGERPYLEYTEDESKNRPGGLRGRHIARKVVKHHANLSNPDRCFVRLFCLYQSHCPSNPKCNSFYLKPLKTPTRKLWYSREPLGHNTLSQSIESMCKAAGITGFRSNHSLRATSATRLYAAGTDEQLIMERTGHRSVEGVRSYKRTSTEQEGVSVILNCTYNAIHPGTSAMDSSQHNTVNCNVQYSSTMPTFSFNSCNSVVINFNK